MNYKFIIAHYNEDLEWIKPYAKNAYIYHKGNDTEPPFDCYHWEKLPNVGREGHTYLYHIIKNYHQLSDINIFLQGNIADHQEQEICPENIEDYYLKLKYQAFYACSGGISKRFEKIKHYGIWQKMINNGNLQLSKLSFTEYFKKIYRSQITLILLYVLLWLFFCQKLSNTRKEYRFL